MPFPLTLLATSDTFRAWLQITNNIADLLNANVVAANTVAKGVFTIAADAATSLAVSNTFFVNTSLILVKANSTLAANVTISANANVFNIAANNLIVQPIQGTTFNSNVTVNAVMSHLAPITANANVTVNGAFSLTGNTIANGSASYTGGVAVRQLTFAGDASVAANTLNNPQYNDANFTGQSNCQILNLTPNIDAVITGLQAPSTLAANGAQILYIQNLSGSFKITLVSANTSSVANNRIKTPGDINFDILPGSAATLIWTWTNKEWRTLSTTAAVGPQTFANTTISGTLTVNGNSAFTANVAVANLTSNGTLTANNLIVQTSAALPNTSITGNTSLGANTSYTSVLKFSGASARFVLPVGAALWATL